MKISIVIPAYNAADFIAKTLESIFAQTVSVFEVIVVDDGSTDGTPEVLEKLDDQRVTILRQENAGVSSARNMGFNASNGDHIVFLDADDILAPDAVSRFVEMFDKFPDAAFVYGEARTFRYESELPAGGDAIAGTASPVFAPRPQGDVSRAMLVHNLMTSVGVAMVRRAAIEKSEMFPVGIKLGEDWVFWCDLAALGPAVWLGPEPVLFYRIHEASAARRLSQDPDALAPAIDAMYLLASVRSRFAEQDLRRLRRLTTAASYAYCGQEMLKNKEWLGARRAFQKSIMCRPFYVRTWILWACSGLRYVPAPIDRRLK